MKVLRYNSPRNAEIIEVPKLEAGANRLLCRSLYCSISAGTEMGFYRGTAPQFDSCCDNYLNFKDSPGYIGYPMQSDSPGVWWMGYANVSRVIETGTNVKEFKVGDIVFSRRGHCDHQLLKEDEALKIPNGMNMEHAALLSLIEIAFNGILDSNIKLAEYVVVFGLGTIGQMIVQMAKACGASVIAVDSLPGRLELAGTCGADLLLNFKKTDVVNAIHEFCGGRGADVVLESSGNISALVQATKASSYNGRIVVLSFYQSGAENLFLGKEFHHKRLNIVSSQISGISPEISGRWNMKRRQEAALSMLPRLKLDPLISSRVAFEDLPTALDNIDKDPASCRAVIVKY